MNCPNCNHAINLSANAPQWLVPRDWAFYGTLTTPVGEVDNRHTYGRLRGEWTVETLPRAIKCKTDDFVHFYVDVNGVRSHRLAVISDKTDNDRVIQPTEKDRPIDWLN